MSSNASTHAVAAIPLSSTIVPAPIPQKAGVGLRTPHIGAFLADKPDAAWLEVHSENYMMAGGIAKRNLERLRADYPISCHGVSLSLGSADGLDTAHLARLKSLMDWIQPGLVSEHLSWSAFDGVYYNDLLPLPYTPQVLDLVAAHVDQTQNALKRQILVENPSVYLEFSTSTMGEGDFLRELVDKTGCGLLLDVNNIYVSCQNIGGNPRSQLRSYPLSAVQEIHLAGHLVTSLDDETVLIDDHGSQICDAVWALYQETLALTGVVPTLIEWDENIPPLEQLLQQASHAQRFLDTMPQVSRHVG